MGLLQIVVILFVKLFMMMFCLIESLGVRCFEVLVYFDLRIVNLWMDFVWEIWLFVVFIVCCILVWMVGFFVVFVSDIFVFRLLFVSQVGSIFGLRVISVEMKGCWLLIMMIWLMIGFVWIGFLRVVGVMFLLLVVMMIFFLCFVIVRNFLELKLLMLFVWNQLLLLNVLVVVFGLFQYFLNMLMLCILILLLLVRWMLILGRVGLIVLIFDLLVRFIVVGVVVLVRLQFLRMMMLRLWKKCFRCELRGVEFEMVYMILLFMVLWSLLQMSLLNRVNLSFILNGIFLFFLSSFECLIVMLVVVWKILFLFLVFVFCLVELYIFLKM